LAKDILTTMDSWVSTFILACIVSLLWHALPPVSILPILTILSIVCLLLPYGKTVSGYLLGTVWMASVGHWQLSWQLPELHTRQVVEVQGQVKSLMGENERVTFNFSVDQISERQFIFPAVIRLSWQQPPWPLKQGQKLRLEVKLKPPHGLANEGGFNYQQWLFSEGIVATGYVKQGQGNVLILDSPSVRQSLLDKLVSLHLSQGRYLLALSFGYRGLLEQSDWLLLQQTGLAHLFAISGLHLGIVASVSYWLFTTLTIRLSARHPRLHYLNFHYLGLLSALVCSGFYAALAGFSLPTLRALVMMCLASWMFFNHSYWSLARLLLYTFFVIVILFPLSLFAVSLWLSFSAVGIICLIVWRWPTKGSPLGAKYFVLLLCRIQLSLSLLMLPLVAWQFGTISLISPLLNLFTVPFVTLVLVPLCLLASLLLLLNIPQGEWLFQLANILMEWIMAVIRHAAGWPVASIDVMQLPLFAWVLAGIAFILMLLPKLPIHKSLLLVLLLPLASYLLPKQQALWRVDILDVGQGLSVVISQSRHVIIYDVGASYPSGFNMADAVILPLLKSRGVVSVDKVFISHSDNDHAGGLQQLKNHIAIGQVLTNQDLCRQNWQDNWQGLSLTVLWPPPDKMLSDNDSSCVLRISDGLHTIMLPGDISANVERQLLDNFAEKLAANILVAPHHGSNTSSSYEFINGVQPDYVVFSQGFMNRWGFPKTAVVERYLGLGAEVFTTSETGQVSFIIDPSNEKTIDVATYRQQLYPYWYAN
jgi:competence protein ComEC